MRQSSHSRPASLARGLSGAFRGARLGDRRLAGAQPRWGEVQIGADNNNVDNPLVQPRDAALSGGGRDQSLQNGNILDGTRADDVQIGLLGIDVIGGGRGGDVQIGGPDPGPPNNDRAFSGSGTDVFLWQPGDGSDFFDGSPQSDAVVFGNIQIDEDQEGVPFLEPHTHLPVIDVTNNGGFCEVVDGDHPDECGGTRETRA